MEQLKAAREAAQRIKDGDMESFAQDAHIVAEAFLSIAEVKPDHGADPSYGSWFVSALPEARPGEVGTGWQSDHGALLKAMEILADYDAGKPLRVMGDGWIVRMSAAIVRQAALSPSPGGGGG